MAQIGTSICILRSILPGDAVWTAWFAPIRATRFHHQRSHFGGAIQDQASPDTDLRVELNLDPRIDIMIVANLLAKIERSPLYLIDAGSDGTCRILEPSDLQSLIAGSMGMVVPLAISSSILETLPIIMADNHRVCKGVVELASMLYDRWPKEILSLRPSTTSWDIEGADPKVNAIMGIAVDLVKVSPLITGTFPPEFRRSVRPDLQCLRSFVHHRMRDLKISDLQKEDEMIMIRAIVILLTDRRFPSWTMMLLEDLFTPFVQELVRYIPHLFHLRSAPWYGGITGSSNPVVIEGHAEVDQRIVDQLVIGLSQILGDLRPLDRPDPISIEQKIQIRNLWTAVPQNPATPIIHRPDLDIVFDLTDWQKSLSAFAARMSAIYDLGRIPATILLKHIVDQFWNPASNTFGISPLGVGSPIIYNSLNRAADP